MRVSIIVRDSMVYLDGEPVQVAMPESCQNLKAVQWGENGVEAGHIELFDGTNVAIDAQAFAEFADVVSAAQQALSEQTTPGFAVDRQRVEDFNVFKVTASRVGGTTVVGDQKDINRATESIRVSMVTRGSRQYSSEKGAFAPVTLSVGDFNIDLPDMTADDKYTVTALTADTEYYCVSKNDLTPFAYQRFSVATNGDLTIPAGKNALIGGGVTSLGTGPVVIASSATERVFTVTSGTAFGIIF